MYIHPYQSTRHYKSIYVRTLVNVTNYNKPCGSLQPPWPRQRLLALVRTKSVCSIWVVREADALTFWELSYPENNVEITKAKANIKSVGNILKNYIISLFLNIPVNESNSHGQKDGPPIKYYPRPHIWTGSWKRGKIKLTNASLNMCVYINA